VKHDFYSNRLRGAENGELDASLSAGLIDEIAAIKVTMRRLLELAEQNENQNVENLSSLLNLMGMTGVKLASMMRTQKLLGAGQDDELGRAITDALKEAMKEWKITNAP
jgi:hypothetical protein